MAVSAGHHRREHSIFPRGHVHCRRTELCPAWWARGINLLQHLASYANCSSERPPAPDLETPPPGLLLGPDLPPEPAEKEPAPPARRPRRKTRRTAGSSGV